jgi:hypothetical protein
MSSHIVNGKRYPNFVTAFEWCGHETISLKTARYRYNKKGWSAHRAITTPRLGMRIIIDGRSYHTLRSAWRAESPQGVSYGVVNNRIQRGWDIHVALLASIE